MKLPPRWHGAAEARTQQDRQDGKSAAPPRQALERTTFTTSRLIEFCSIRELTTQTGHGPEHWPLVVLKELVDNALDACEEAGAAPRVEIEVEIGNGGLIAVTDNGPGIPPETVETILDFATRTSSREAYVSPTRGAQGNALKTVLAMPFALDREAGRVTIDARGVRHIVAFRVDPIRQAPEIDHHREAGLVSSGTRIEVEWPASPWSQLDDHEDGFLQLAAEAAWLNPHFSVALTWDGEEELRVAASDPTWRKWGPSDPTSAHWYNQDRFERLIAAYLAHDQDAGRDRTVREFVVEFDGLSGTAKQKAVLDATGLARAPFTALVNSDGALDRGRIAGLLDAMRATSRPVKPDRLGLLGRTHLEAAFDSVGAVLGTFKYRAAKGATGGVPWIVEAAFAYAPDLDQRLLVAGVNWSPALGVPFRPLDGWLAGQHAGPSEPVIAFVHLATARPEFTDRGKVSLAAHAPGFQALEDAVKAVTEAWAKQRRAEIRDRSATRRRVERLARRRERSIKDAAWEAIPDAYAKASAGGTLPATARQVMYAARGAIQAATTKALDDKYFTQTLLPDFMAQHPELTAGWDVVFDARGTLHEPHTDRSVPLGTLDVRGYLTTVRQHRASPRAVEGTLANLPLPGTFPTIGPDHAFGGILFVEKEGFLPLFRAVELAERFDLAIMSTKGMSVTASRSLVDELCGQDVPLLVLHDFDKAGFSIIGTLCDDTRRYAFRNRIEVVDLGLRLKDVEGWALESEASFDVKGAAAEATLRRHGASEVEIGFLRQQRVELNAFSSDRLITWLEAKLEQIGVRKVVPPDDVLAIAWRRASAIHHFDDEASALARQIELDAAVEPVPSDLRVCVEQLLRAQRQLSWKVAVSRLQRKQRSHD